MAKKNEQISGAEGMGIVFSGVEIAFTRTEVIFSDGSVELLEKIQARCLQHVQEDASGEPAATLERVIEFANKEIAGSGG